MDQPDGNVLQFQAGGLNLTLLRQEERNKCVCVCMYMCMCVHACVYMPVCVCGGRGVFTAIVSGGQRVSTCSQEIFPPSEKHFTCAIPKEGKGENVKSNGGVYMDRRKSREKALS